VLDLLLVVASSTLCSFDARLGVSLVDRLLACSLSSSFLLHFADDRGVVVVLVDHILFYARPLF
jgi:hypothetical protein